MQVDVVAVGRLRPEYRALADLYLARLRKPWKITEHEVREAGRAGNDAVQRREEARRLREATPAGAVVVALTRSGAPWASSELARRLGQWRDAGQRPAFVVGGAAGLDDSFIEACDADWSLGPLTLPHELARVVLLEQLYRARTILSGHPYHRARS